METDPAEHRSDWQLVQETLLGHDAAVEQFIERVRCVPLILAARNTRLGRPLNDEDLADLSQDTLEVVWRKLATYSGRSSLESWVYSFCVYQMMNAIRSKMRHLQSLPDPAHADLEPAAPEPSSPMDYEHVHGSLARLAPSQADVIRLKHFAALTFEQIAARVDMPTNTVKAHYYRGLEKLRELLKPHLREEYA